MKTILALFLICSTALAGEFTNHVEMVLVRNYCTNCGGEFKFTGQVFTTSPPTYSHKCSGKCGTEQEFGCRYPDLRYNEITTNFIFTPNIGHK